MATILSGTMLTYLRVMLNDINIDLQEYTDEDLITNLRLGVALSEAFWDQGYILSLNASDWEISPDVPSWLQVFYVLNTAIHMKVFQLTYSFDNGVSKVTNVSKDHDVKILLKTFDDILQERRYGDVVGYCQTVFDDLFTRPNLIMNEIAEGYR